MAIPGYVNLVVDGRQHGQDQDVERTTFDDGFVRQEKRYRSALVTRSVAGWLRAQDVQRFQAWARVSAHLWFDWNEPGQDTMRVRIRGGASGITYTARVQTGKLTWDVSFTLEGAP